MSATVDVLAASTAEIVSAFVGRNPVAQSELGNLIMAVRAALEKASTGSAPVEPEAPAVLTPAVPIKKSVTPDYIVSLENGKKFKSLKRHLSSTYGMTPDQYRAKWGLPSDYPMVAPNYAASRSALAKSMGLGRKAKVEVPPPAPARRGRPRKVQA